MIDFNNLIVNRIIIHTINAKKGLQDTATVEYSSEILEIDESVLATIKIRLIDAAGKNSKAFELDVENTNNGSFYDLSKDIETKTDPEYIIATSEIADLLASSQTRVSIPGGYLISMDCTDSDTGLPIHIVIKAEPHEALQFSVVNGLSQISLLTKVFLSPSQKLYKIGILYKKEDHSSESVNDQYGCFLYDEQFRSDTHPAEYFYKDFLGFSVGKNAKIQSQRFFDKTQNFIHEKISDLNTKQNLLNVLKLEFTTNTSATLNPSNFANTYLPAGGIRDSYIGDICQELPFSIVKDSSLIRTKLAKRKIDFPSNINIVGPEEGFDSKVSIVTDINEIDQIDLNSNTIVKISGKPYSNE